jgi:hypothetical protein
MFGFIVLTVFVLNIEHDAKAIEDFNLRKEEDRVMKSLPPEGPYRWKGKVVLKMKAKCIDASSFTEALTVGKIYDITPIATNSHYVDFVGDNGLIATLLKYRFQEVVVAIIKCINTDPPEWKPFSNSRPGECPCGSTRGICPYHPW